MPEIGKTSLEITDDLFHNCEQTDFFIQNNEVKPKSFIKSQNLIKSFIWKIIFYLKKNSGLNYGYLITKYNSKVW